MPDLTPLLTFPLTDPRRQDVEEQMGVGPFQQVQRLPNRPVGMCYWNVDAISRIAGGEMVLGWQIHWWPEIFVVAIHHAIWKRRDSFLVDVTEGSPGDEKGKVTTFAPDNSIQIDLARPSFIPNRFVVLREVPGVQELQVAEKRQLDVKREIADLAAKLGIPFDPGKGAGLPRDHPELPGLLARFEQTKHEITAARRLLKQNTP